MSECKNRNTTVMACKNCTATIKDEWHPCYDTGTGIEPKAEGVELTEICNKHGIEPNETIKLIAKDIKQAYRERILARLSKKKDELIKDIEENFVNQGYNECLAQAIKAITEA